MRPRPSLQSAAPQLAGAVKSPQQLHVGPHKRRAFTPDSGLDLVSLRVLLQPVPAKPATVYAVLEPQERAAPQPQLRPEGEQRLR